VKPVAAELAHVLVVFGDMVVGVVGLEAPAGIGSEAGCAFVQFVFVP